MKYTTTAIITLTGGILELNEDQARRRLRNLKDLKDGRFEIVQAVQFKAGETFGYDGQISKAQAESLIEADKVVASIEPKPAKKKERAE